MKKPTFITGILRRFRRPNPVDLFRLGFEQRMAGLKAIGPRPVFKLSPELAALLTEPGPTMTIATRMEGIPAHVITAGMPIPLIWCSLECGKPQHSSARGGAVTPLADLNMLRSMVDVNVNILQTLRKISEQRREHMNKKWPDYPADPFHPNETL